VAAWLGSLEDSPVKTSASPVAATESTVIEVGCFSISADSFASWNPSSGSFLKTCRQSSLSQQVQPFSENLPHWGLMRRGELYEQPTWAPRISGTERSFLGSGWPTPRSEDSESGGNHPGAVDSLTGAVKMWPTPIARDWKSGEASAETSNRNSRPLNEAVTGFSLPDQPTSTHGEPSSPTG
jgi:hypothetical protein